MGEAQQFVQREREPDRGDQRDLSRRAVERLENPSARRDSPSRRDERGRDQRGREHERGRPSRRDPDPGRGGISARRREGAEGEIDPPDDPVNQRISRREQGVDRHHRQAVDRLLQDIGDPRRQVREARDVAERGGVRRARLGRREPETVEKIAVGFAERRAVDLDADEVGRARRPPRRAKPAGREMRDIAAAGRPCVVGDFDPAAVPAFALRVDCQPGVRGFQRGQRHPAEPRLISLQERRAAGDGDRQAGDRDGASPGRDGQASRALAPCRRCLARLPQISISHQRRLLFFETSKNSQPHFSPWHCFMRDRSACRSVVIAESEIGPSTASTGEVRTTQLQA